MVPIHIVPVIVYLIIRVYVSSCYSMLVLGGRRKSPIGQEMVIAEHYHITRNHYDFLTNTLTLSKQSPHPNSWYIAWKYIPFSIATPFHPPELLPESCYVRFSD